MREHFAGHPGFLAIDLDAGVTWQTVCDFLGEEVPRDWRGRPAVELPRTNTRGGRERRARWPGIYRARDRARALVYRVLGPRLGDSVRSLYSSVVYRARRR